LYESEVLFTVQFYVSISIEIQDIFLILIICTYWNLLYFLWSMPARKMVCYFICKSKRSTLLYMNAAQW